MKWDPLKAKSWMLKTAIELATDGAYSEAGRLLQIYSNPSHSALKSKEGFKWAIKIILFNADANDDVDEIIERYAREAMLIAFS